METDTTRQALVTGGNRGIGEAISRHLAGIGMKVALTYHSRRQEAEALAEEIGARSFALDVGKADQVRELARRIEDELGPVEVLVHNAGMTHDAPLAFIKEEHWDSVLDVNLKGPFLLTRALLKGMIRQRWGRVITLASAAGVIGHAGQTPYSAAKGGLIAFTKSLALELARFGVTANAVAPGFIDTQMLAAIPEKKLEAYRGMIPLKRFGRPEEVGALVGFLCSEAAGYITGQTLRIDGGMITA